VSHLRYFLILSLLALVMALPATGSGQGSWREAPRRSEDVCEVTCRAAPDSELESLILEVLGPRAIHYGVVVEHLERATGAGVNSDKLFEPASLFKLAVMHEVFRQRESGQLRFDEQLTTTARAATWDLGTLWRWGFIGQRVSIERLLETMITISDNASAIMLADRVGWRRVDQGLQELGMHATRTIPPPQTTARDMAVLLAAIARSQAVSVEASAEMKALLLRQTIGDRIPAGVPEGVLVGNKTGNLPNATHDVAIVYAPSGAYVLAVLSDLPWTPAPIVAISSAVYAYYDNNDGIFSSAS
jgi:beta-lactamase class A